jgi:hypothetical protein
VVVVYHPQGFSSRPSIGFCRTRPRWLAPAVLLLLVVLVVVVLVIVTVVQVR